ncbi:MAG: hypothetical protein LBM77_13695, partial [Spirochaetaceae bacterium]|nr:hypothetical protein [Spirochaetaceae bacterium]
MRRLLKVGIVIVLAALLAFSCSPLGFESGEDSFTFILSLDTNGMRTISPKVDDYKLLNNFDTFSLKIDQGQNNIFTKDTIEIDKESGVISETITLSPGQVYTATAGAKIGGILAAQGVAEFVATSNEGSVAVRLKPIPVNLEGNAGTENAYFQYTITIPASYTASVSLLGPKAVGASAELLTDQLNATIYASLNELWADARIAGEGSYIYNMPPQLFKEGIYDFIVTVRDGTHEKRIVDETAYLYSGLTTKAEGAKFSFTEESINFTNDVLLSGTVNIINTAEQDIGDIYIAVYKGLSGLSNSLTFNTITPENDENLLTFCKLNAVGNAQLISKTWGMKTDAISLNDTLYLKAFSSKTAGCDASVVDRYFESDRKAAQNLQTVTYSGGP